MRFKLLYWNSEIIRLSWFFIDMQFIFICSLNLTPSDVLLDMGTKFISFLDLIQSTRNFMFLYQYQVETMMEGEADNTQLEYNELMAKLNQLRIQINGVEDKNVKIKQLDQDIVKINALIQNAQNQSIDNTATQAQLKRQDQRISQLQRLIEEEQRNRKQIESLNQGQIQKLQRELDGKNELLSSNPNVAVDEETINKAVSENHAAADQLRQIQRLEAQISELQHGNRQLQSEFQELRTSSQQKEQQYREVLEKSTKGQQVQKEKASQIQKLQNQLRQLNEDFDNLKRTLQAQQARQASKSEQNRHKKQAFNRQLSDLQELRDKLSRELQLKQKERGVQRDKLINQSNILIQQKQLLSNLEKQHSILEKHSQQLDKRTSELRKKLKDLKEQQKSAVKNKGERNFKLQMLQLQNQIQLLQKQTQREKKKHSQIAKVRSTYVSQSQLNKLQEEFKKLNEQVKPVQSEEKKNKKLKDQNKLLRDRIQYLRKADQQVIKEKKNQILEIKTKAKNLLEQKQFYEKSIAHNQAKLNQYIKEYPKHQAEKELRRKAKKHHRTTDENAKLNHHESEDPQLNQEQINAKKRRNRKKGKNTEQAEEQVFMQQGIIRQSQTSGNQIYKNKNVQVAALTAIVIFGLILFSMLN